MNWPLFGFLLLTVGGSIAFATLFSIFAVWLEETFDISFAWPFAGLVVAMCAFVGMVSK
jgi:hypothetical protein